MTSNLSANSNQSCVTAVHMTLQPSGPLFSALGREFIDSLHREVSCRFGGSCRGLSTDNGVTAELRGPGFVAAKTYIDSLLKSVRRAYPASTVNLTIELNPRRTLTPAEEGLAASQDTSPFKLSRTVFMNLRGGEFLVSNVYSPGGGPVFAAPVVGREERGSQWAHIKASGADQRMCRVFPNAEAYRAWESAMRQFFSRGTESSTHCGGNQALAQS